MQFSAIIAIAFSSAVMASPSFMDSIVKARQQDVTGCMEAISTDAACTQGVNLFCSNVNTGVKCPNGLVERFDDSVTRLNEEACAGLTATDQCTMNVFCCPA